MANPQYICSFIVHSILPSSPYPYSFPSHSLTSSPISLSIHFHFPTFPIPPQSFPHIPRPRCTFSYLHTLPSFPHIHPITAYNPHTPTLHPLPHVSPHPPTHALLTTLYALLSTLSRSLTLFSHSIAIHTSTLPYVPRETYQ